MADNLLSSFLPDDRAATGFFPQMKPRRRFQDREASANVPLDVTRGRVAGLAGLLPDTLNFMGRSPMPTEQFGETQYEPAPQLPYGSEFYLENLPLKPTSRIGEVAGQAGAFVPLNPMPAARAVAAGARALGPTAVRMGEGYLQRQGLMPQLDVYHGSPHKFDRFDASKIGTGEGAQAYGHGIYMAENPGTAEGYQKALSNRPDASRNLYYNGKEVGGLAKSWKEQDINDFAIRALQDVPSGMGSDQKAIVVAQQVRKVFPDAPLSWEDQVTEAARLIDANKSKILKGNFYKVDLPDKKIARMLDWDKPLSEQPEFVRNTLINDMGVDDNWATVSGDSSGGALYNSMVKEYGSPEAVSAALMNQGIPGIKYLDATSRGAGTGTRNFVTFPGEEKSLTILERNGQRVMPGIFPTSITRNEVKNIANDFAIQFKQMGFDVTVDHSGSKAGASSYLKVYDPQTGRFLEKPIRISDHSKGAKELDANINILNPQEDLEKIKSVLNDMRAKGESLVFKQNKYAQELIAGGVKPKTAYQRAKTEIIESELLPVPQQAAFDPFRKSAAMEVAAPIGGIGLGAGMQDQQQNRINSFIP